MTILLNESLVLIYAELTSGTINRLNRSIKYFMWNCMHDILNGFYPMYHAKLEIILTITCLKSSLLAALLKKYVLLK